MLVFFPVLDVSHPCLSERFKIQLFFTERLAVICGFFLFENRHFELALFKGLLKLAFYPFAN